MKWFACEKRWVTLWQRLCLLLGRHYNTCLLKLLNSCNTSANWLLILSLKIKEIRLREIKPFYLGNRAPKYRNQDLNLNLDPKILSIVITLFSFILWLELRRVNKITNPLVLVQTLLQSLFMIWPCLAHPLYFRLHGPVSLLPNPLASFVFFKHHILGSLQMLFPFPHPSSLQMLTSFFSSRS